MEPLVTALNDQEEEQMKHMLKRINTIAEVRKFSFLNFTFRHFFSAY